MATALHQISLSLWDWVMVVFYIGLTIGVAIWSKYRQRDTVEEYFVGGRSMHWMVVSLSIFATLCSSMAFVATPGEAYENGLLFSLFILGNIVATPVAAWLFLRFFFHTPSFTAYEYLEKRYNVSVRVLGAGIFTAVRILYMGCVFYATAKLFESLVGWPPLMTIVIVGGITIAYTASGGIKAAAFTDVAQSVIIVIGIGIVLWKILSLAGYSPVAIYQFAAEHGRGYEPLASSRFYRMNLADRINLFFLVTGSFFTAVTCMACDQLTVQRMLASKGYREAKRAAIVNAFTSAPVGLMFWFVGIGLFYFYHAAGKGHAPEGMTSDYVMGYFVSTQLPSPIPGLIVAAILAALMSTISSVVNSCATVIHCDGLLRLGIVEKSHPKEMLICRGLSVLSGCLGLAIAVWLVMASDGIKSSVLEVAGLWGALWNMLIAAFIFGVLVPRISGRAMFIGMLIGSVVSLVLPYPLYYMVPAEDRIAFSWIGVPSMAAAFILPLLLSFIWPNKKPLPDLTIWTLSKRDKSSSGGLDEQPSGQPCEAEVR